MPRAVKGLNNIAQLKNLFTDSLKHAAIFSLVNIEIVLLILGYNFPILSLHLAKDDNIERLAKVCGVGNITEREDLRDS